MLQQRLQEISGDLHELFRNILTRDSQKRGELLLCLQWVLFARDPLLYFAILEPEVALTKGSVKVTKDVIKRFILHSSSLKRVVLAISGLISKVISKAKATSN